MIWTKKGLGVGAIIAVMCVGCGEDKPAAPIAPSASALAPAKPASVGAKKFEVDKASSKVDFLMDAPKEKIRGKMHASMTGDLQIDLDDVTKTTGVLSVDVGTIEVFQTKADDKGTFGNEVKDEHQNQHVKNWLEISPETKEDARKANSVSQFSIKSIEVTGEKNIGKMTGAERKVALKAKGEYLLHGHKTEKLVELTATFTFEGDKPIKVHIKTDKPFGVVLAEHDVKPRDAIGKLLAKGLDALAPKVAKDAMVTLDFAAQAK